MPRRNLYGLILIGIFSLACYFQAQHNRYGRAAAERAGPDLAPLLRAG